MENKPEYYLDKDGCFVIKNYNYAKPFANFFPGIAGKYGIPMWVFYVNRGQCICSYGVKDKDHAILEFSPANKSWQSAPVYGFRTFLKIEKGKSGGTFYEPFHDGYANLKYRLVNSMRVGSADLSLEEENCSLGIKTRVKYFNIPNDNYAGLCRLVTVKNTGKMPKSIQLIDGLPQIVPFGTNNFFLKAMSRTIEAWMKVDNLGRFAPFYRLQVDPSDRPEVVRIEEGNFYFGFCRKKGGKAEMLMPIVDPQAVFGTVTDFSYPAEFLKKTRFSYPKNQILEGRTPGALLFAQMKLKPGEEKTFYVLTGQARDIETLNRSVKKIILPGYIEEKIRQNDELIKKLKNNIFTASGSPAFDLYAGQTYLDNIMRGGYPELLGEKTVFYLYSRKHGDLERDYNKFHIQPTYLSQGNGNYRDANQNRRSDLWFNPAIGEENIVSFMNLIQTDGFNPLIVKPESFRLKESADLKLILKDCVEESAVDLLLDFLKKPFSPGELLFFIEKNKIEVKVSYDDFLSAVLSSSSKTQEAEHGEGFWTDHWAYNLDLIESYLGLYPERSAELFFNNKAFSYFDNAETVKPRNEKYVLYGGKPHQLHSLIQDNEKKELLRSRASDPHLARTSYGKGEIYYTTLIAKLLCLAVNKLASLDPFGTGVEMEANKPNWFDALNGLPALFGSSTCETFELKRLLQIIRDALKSSPSPEITLAEEIARFIEQLSGVLAEDTLTYWDKSGTIKEDYRALTRLGLSGAVTGISLEKINFFLDQALNKVAAGLSRAFDKERGVYRSYFINQVSEYDLIDSAHFKPKKFSQIPVPLFLEGQVHALRLSKDTREALALHQATKKSPLFDKKLKMYKVTESLKPMPEEIGRCRVFTPGWLENESVWLHMEYKYLLELLKNGLEEEFYAEFKNVLVPFQDPRVYGRSILENSSFIVSSAHPDKRLHGNGFVARLSGSTAEFLQIWLLMNTGRKPFSVDAQGNLSLTFKPSLPGWLFDKNGKYSFNFLSCVRVTYHNAKKKNTYGKDGARVEKIVIPGENGPLEIDSPVIPPPYAEKIRSRQVKAVDIYLV